MPSVAHKRPAPRRASARGGRSVDPVTSEIILGDFSNLYIGIRTALRVEVLRETFAGNFQYGFLAFLRADVAAVHEEAFCRITGIIP